MTDTDMGFFQGINSGEVGSLIGLTANCLQIYGFGAQLISSLVSESDKDQILDAVASLEQKMDDDFSALGALIDQQIKLVLENEDSIALASAMAHTGTAMDKLTRYLRVGDPADLESADTESDLGIQFFLALPETASDPSQASQTQPFFIPGITKAGTVRVLVLMANDGVVRRIASDVQQIKAIIALADGMIGSVSAAVDSAHTVVLKTTEIPNAEAADEDPLTPGTDRRAAGGAPEVIYDGYDHEERGQVLGFYSADGARTFNDPRVTRAKAAADAGRKQGVAEELAFLGIPQIESLVGKWQALLVNPVTVGQVAPIRNVGLARG